MSVTPEEEMVLPSEVLSQDISVEGITSRVNGKGLWNSWQRNFKTPELALLDLFDNAIDATLHEDFTGKIQIYEDPALFEDDPVQGICMRNNCATRIPDLASVLEVFGSQKHTDQIGENGVGTKQACAALSDLSIVMSKNKKKISIGLLDKSLQQVEGCCLPSYDMHSETLLYDLDLALCGNQELRDSLEEYGAGNISQGRQRVVSHIEELIDCEDDYVFLVVLHRVIHRGSDGGVAGMLNTLKAILPRHYLHIPPEFEITVDEERLTLQFWERRLAELHHFPIRIDPTHDYYLAEDWHMPNSGHVVDLYLGFDPIRAGVENKNKAALLIYSRKSGRLVKEVKDARGMLGLASGGTDYGQGLTIIMDDIRGRLSLTPTKQDLAFGMEATGKVHEENLFSWIGAFAHLYYQHFLFKFGEKKANLREEVLTHVSAVEALETISVPETLSSGVFSTFEGAAFSRQISKGKIRCCNRPKCIWKLGKDTRIKFRKAAPTPTKAAKKRGSPSKKKGSPRKSTPSKSASKKRMAADDEKFSPRKRKGGLKVENLEDSDDELVEQLRSDLTKQKWNFSVIEEANKCKLQLMDSQLEEAQAEITSLRAALPAANETPSRAAKNDIALQETLKALRKKCKEQEHELKETRDLTSENERLKAKVAAQKAYMVDLQRLNESLRNLSDL